MLVGFGRRLYHQGTDCDLLNPNASAVVSITARFCYREREGLRSVVAARLPEYYLDWWPNESSVTHEVYHDYPSPLTR